MQRLFMRSRLAAGAVIDLDRGQTNYLANVLRMNAGAAIRVFNGREGEWRASLTQSGRRGWALTIEERGAGRRKTRPDLHYLFAPLKQARLDYMVQKAVEMGVGRAGAGPHPARPGRPGELSSEWRRTQSRPRNNAAS